MPQGRLLVVDDEPALADLLRRYLERLGYFVEICASAEQALALADGVTPGDGNTPAFNLVITDLTLDGINGEELIDQLRTRIPDLPAILVSGYPHVPRSRNVEFLQKPFLPKMLAELLVQKLGESGSAA